MESPVRVLFASSEVVPFAGHSDMGQVVRDLPEQLLERGTFESRIMMPRYGLISERRNRLHEVIRLSGCKIRMAEEAQSLKVKVASIPGIRLQVYFMDNSTLFKRKGIYEGPKSGEFEDNLERAVFFARAVLKTTSNLGWSPDIVHAHGWLASLVPLVLKHEYAEHELFNKSRCVFSSDSYVSGSQIPAGRLSAFGFPEDDRVTGHDLTEAAVVNSDAVIVHAGMQTPANGAISISGSREEIADKVAELYLKLMNQNVLA